MPASSSPVEVFVNGEPRRFADGATVATLVDELGLSGGRVAVELNRSILPRAEWNRPLVAGDRLEVVAFVGGG